VSASPLKEAKIDLASIKSMAKDKGCSVTDLIVLAPQNDPFYVGTPADIASSRWFADVWERGAFRHGAHLRRIHYWCTSQVGLTLPNGKRYENTLECWQALNQASKAARYLGLVSISEFADHKNPTRTSMRNIPAIASPSMWMHRISVSPM